VTRRRTVHGAGAGALAALLALLALVGSSGCDVLRSKDAEGPATTTTAIVSTRSGGQDDGPVLPEVDQGGGAALAGLAGDYRCLVVQGPTIRTVTRYFSLSADGTYAAEGPGHDPKGGGDVSVDASGQITFADGPLASMVAWRRDEPLIGLYLLDGAKVGESKQVREASSEICSLM
jgi:hypothetical protein